MDKNLIEIRKNIVRMAHYSHASHIGSALSVVDILYVIYTRLAHISLDNLTALQRDKVILSKGHASIALYAVLAQQGLLNQKYLQQYYIDGGLLPGHLDKDSVPGIDCSAGSLGHGLPIGIGMALADPKHQIFVIMGDGEVNEGSVWEAFMFAGKHPLPNLKVIIDHNRLQGFGTTNEIADYSKLTNTLQNWGMDSTTIDGHNLDQIYQTLSLPTQRTQVVVARTVKGKGISFMENQFKWHYKSPNDEELAIALRELDV